MKVGYNYPWGWNKYGINFGPGRDLNAWETTLPKNLLLLQDLGISVVRWFLMGNCWNYGPMPDLVFTPDRGWQYECQTIDNPAQIFRDSKTGIKLIPSFCDFGMGGRIGYGGGGGRVELIRNHTKRDKFLDTMLEGFLSVAVENKDQIYAFEMMNEPCWLYRNISKPVNLTVLPAPAAVEFGDLQEFLRLGVSKINAKGLPSTVGHRFFDDLALFGPDCTGTIRQFHYYPTLPVADLLLPTHADSQAILGEFSTRADISQGQPWPDCAGNDVFDNAVVEERLGMARSKGYELALVWPDLDDNALSGDVLKLSGAKQQSLKRFTQKS
jgi:hypothetical protein